MFIILSIYSKNLNSLTDFLKFFYKFKTNKIFEIKFCTVQSQQRRQFFFLSTLQSPHVNKKSQEQFGYYTYSKKLKINIFQMAKFLAIWKTVNTALFPDIKINTRFQLCNKPVKLKLTNKINVDKFKLKFLKKEKTSYMNKFKKQTVTSFTPKQLFNAQAKNLKLRYYKKVSNTTAYTFLKLLDINGEILQSSCNFNCEPTPGEITLEKSV